MARNEKQEREALLKHLAVEIDALSAKDESELRRIREIAELRHAAARELHTICSDFLRDINPLLKNGELLLDPPEFQDEHFDDDASNLLQLHIRGRILQVEYTSTQELISTEDFRIPYILQGFVRAFNQELLDKDLIEEQLIFYTLEKQNGMWRFFDARTYRSGPFDEDYLISLMRQLI